ncbi:MAG: hypothetical protein QXT44_03065 [Candidatus Bathyarchaeia archaeon]
MYVAKGCYKNIVEHSSTSIYKKSVRNVNPFKELLSEKTTCPFIVIVSY